MNPTLRFAAFRRGVAIVVDPENDGFEHALRELPTSLSTRLPCAETIRCAKR
jgi:hypothetical protein